MDDDECRRGHASLGRRTLRRCGFRVLQDFGREILARVWLEEKCRLTQNVVAGSFRASLAGLK